MKIRGADVSEFFTKQLSKKTWRDFERLFETHPAPGAYPCWCMYHHRSGPERKGASDSRALRIERNHQAKRALAERGSSHGILVYSEGEPVGWCQYGLRNELSRIDNSFSYRRLTPVSGGHRLWRITCFVVPSKYRRRGIATIALKAALAAIQSDGGGLVEAYPIRNWNSSASYRGTVSMFEREGFKVVGPLGASNVLMRRAV
jgi:ribosomal protein S18 acetylase RimI-like enzyme